MALLEDDLSLFIASFWGAVTEFEAALLIILSFAVLGTNFLTQGVASAVEEQTASFEEASANISSINEMAEKLTKIVCKFRI